MAAHNPLLTPEDVPPSRNIDDSDFPDFPVTADADTIKARKIRRPTGTKRSLAINSTLDAATESTNTLEFRTNASPKSSIIETTPQLPVKLAGPISQSPTIVSSQRPIITSKMDGRAQLNADDEELKSPSMPSSPPPIHEANLQFFPLAAALASSSRSHVRSHSDAAMDEIISATGNLGLHNTPNIGSHSPNFGSPGSFGSFNRDDVSSTIRRYATDTGEGYRSASEDEQEEELELPRLPPSREEPRDEREGLESRDIDAHFAAMGDIAEDLAKIESRHGQIEYRQKSLDRILEGLKAIMLEAWRYQSPNHPVPQTAYTLDFDIQHFASTPMCPWMKVRKVVATPLFRDLILSFEDILVEFVGAFNDLIPDRLARLKKYEFIHAISKVMIMNFMPRLHLEAHAIPQVEFILEQVDALEDPVSLCPDEDEPLELGIARGLWREFAFVEKVVAMRVANLTAASDRTRDRDFLDEDGFPYVFKLDANWYFQEVMREAGDVPELSARFFASGPFRQLAKLMEDEVNTFLSQLVEVGLTCRKKAFVVGLCQHLVAVVLPLHENAIGVQTGIAGEGELTDAVGYVAGEQGGGGEDDEMAVDEDGDAMMDS